MCWAMLKVGTCRSGVTSLKPPIFDGKNMFFLEDFPQTHIHCVKKMDLMVAYSESSKMG